MSHREALTRQEKEHIYREKLRGKTLTAIASEVGCSYECARKWWRVGRDGGLVALAARRTGRQKIGVLSQFSERVRQRASELKRSHQRWGAARVLVELQQDEEMLGEKLPSASRLSTFFKHVCPESVNRYKAQQGKPAQTPPRPRYVHEVWQMDAQECHRLGDGQIATVCSIREPVAAAVVASQAFAVQTKVHWRKLTITELRSVFRQGFTRWSTMPDAIQTDNETRLGGHQSKSFPTLLTLWFVGLGIEHRFSRPGCPTDQAQVERQHRTLDGWTDAIADRATLDAFNAALQRELDVHNRLLPSRASTCDKRPPLCAFPQLSRPRRPYRPESEPFLFSRQRVYNYLADIDFPRQVSASGQVRIGRFRYNIGRKLARRQLTVRLDANTCHWSFCDAKDDTEVARKAAQGLDFYTLTGLQPDAVCKTTEHFQLPLPMRL